MAAMRYAKQGWYVFPLKPRDKVPMTVHGFKAATCDPVSVAAWWDANPNANIGLVPGLSGLVVIDCDGPEGKKSAEAAGLMSEPTLTVTTGRPEGGFHRYYRLPAGAVVTASDIGPGTTVRYNKGYVVAPPSTHPTGVRYTRSFEAIEELPPKAVALVCRQQEALQKPATAAPLPKTIPAGSRNDTLTSLAGSMRRRNAGEAAILAALLEQNAQCDPPLPESEVESIAESVARYAPAATDAPPPTDTDTGNATRLVTLHGDRLHYIAPWGKWLVWTAAQGRWNLDHRDVQIRELAKDVGRSLKEAAAREAHDGAARRMFAFALKSLDTHGINGMVDLARGVEGIQIEHEALDRDGWTLGVQNGVVELRTGTLRPANPADLMMMQAPVACDAHAQAPRWRRALTEWFPDEAVRAFVQRVAGAALVGVQQDHVFVIHYGGGRNGKGTFVRALQRVLGPYAGVIHLSLLVESKYAQHDTVRAALFRTRLAVASETQRRVKLDEASVKNLTGGDRITARRMREDLWEFDPTHSLWLQTNHLPEISGRDRGIWSRICVVKWETTFSDKQQDRSLDTTLAAEAAGILHWLIEGCLEWQRHGLAEPESVVRETLAYRHSEDTFARFATENGLAFRRGLEIQAGELQRLLTEWAEAEGVDPRRRELGAWLAEHGAKQQQRRERDLDGKARVPRYWRGVGIAADEPEGGQPDALS
jgi:putative DNA primase/helicase